jgi:hypothetical protein
LPGQRDEPLANVNHNLHQQLQVALNRPVGAPIGPKLGQLKLPQRAQFGQDFIKRL